MTPEEMETARAFVACSRWKWLPGMLDTNGGRMVDPGKLLTVRKRVGGILDETWQLHCNPADYISGESEALPDITDPCTLGGILRLVQDAGGLIFKLSIRPMGCQLVVEWPNGRLDGFRGTFSGVLLQALQAAPG